MGRLVGEGRRVDGRHKVLAACGVLAPLQFTLAWVVLGAARPDYDPRRQYVSELAAVGAPDAGPMLAAFLALGLLTLAFAVGLRHALGGGATALIGSALIAVFGLGSLASGLFRCDPGCGGGSPANTAHTVSAHLGLGALILATLVLAVRFGRDRRWAGLRAYSLLTGGVALAIFARGFAAFGGVGLGQRLFLATLFLWLAVVALRLLHLASQPEADGTDSTAQQPHAGPR
ncbi:MAG: hypothetical protein AVDCRST_MAG18-4870 [uncultured Thermomicrobiales bacterium]|uniref:DUF998 domain-containing protein n=1 Tax=uncultured Thermomicrobiales bacterium TaxID=1645740 RepID=A0A6J4VY30_9BACT|nr:MAG: hypothetical protein AVDCRST_MAG18-4870 [uncultured Thermomicrobiales bacterium]